MRHKFHRLQIASAFTVGATLAFLVVSVVFALVGEQIPRYSPLSMAQADNATFVITFLVTVGFGVATALPVVRSDIREDRIRRGCCPRCGYPIQGLEQTENVCPECGHAFRRPEPDHWP